MIIIINKIRYWFENKTDDIKSFSSSERSFGISGETIDSWGKIVIKDVLVYIFFSFLILIIPSSTNLRIIFQLFTSFDRFHFVGFHIYLRQMDIAIGMLFILSIDVELFFSVCVWRKVTENLAPESSCQCWYRIVSIFFYTHTNTHCMWDVISNKRLHCTRMVWVWMCVCVYVLRHHLQTNHYHISCVIFHFLIPTKKIFSSSKEKEYRHCM